MMDGGEMKIRPSGWEFVPTTEFCCTGFRFDANDVTWTRRITTDGKDVFFEGNKISYCPYCGKKIELEKEVEQ